MRIRRIYIRQIIDFLGKKLVAVYGNTDSFIDNLSDMDNVSETTLDWINPKKANSQLRAENSNARVILVDPSIVYTDDIKSKNKTLIVVNNPKVEIARIGNEFFKDLIPQKIHETCIIDAECEIGENVSVGPFSYIGKAKIGSGTTIGSNVHIYDDVIIGKNCYIKDGAVIGGIGFGFERDENGNLFRFPQIGNVCLGDYVEVGANTCIDRGALSTTKIGNYTKINNLCHIAHNNVIGNNVVIAANVNVSGGNVIDDNCWIAPSSSIRGYVHIGKDSTVGIGAIVLKDIPAREVWVGNPAKKLR